METPEVRYVKIIPELPEPSLMEIYIYDPLDYLAVRFLQGSFLLLFIAIISDIFRG